MIRAPFRQSTLGTLLNTLCHEFSITWICKSSSFLIPGIRAGSTKEPAPSTIARGGLHRNAFSGHLSRVIDGASSGPAPIVAPDVGVRKPLGIEYD